MPDTRIVDSFHRINVHRCRSKLAAALAQFLYLPAGGSRSTSEWRSVEAAPHTIDTRPRSLSVRESPTLSAGSEATIAKVILDPFRRMNGACLLCALLVLLNMESVSAEDAESNRFNVLFIAIDDLRPELGCYGVEHAQSPHLDQFATQALVFQRHYVQVATCGASRYSLLTGRSPRTSGVTTKNDAFYAGDTAFSQSEQEAAQSMPELFRRSGYHTSMIGKISHTADGLVYGYDGSGVGQTEMPNAWDERLTPLGAWGRGWGVFFAYANGKHREDGGGHRDLWQFTVERDEQLPDGLNAQAAIRQLKKYKESDTRFFMGLGFYKPHLPFVAPKQDWDAFEGVDIPLPAPGKIDSPYWHKSGEFYKYDAVHEKSNPLADNAVRNSKRAYSACVRFVDRQVGKVLFALDELGLARNTIVVVWGDHGWHLGEQESTLR